MELFDRCGGLERYPYRITDPHDDSDYAITLASRLPLGPQSGMRNVGPLRLAVACLDVSGIPLSVVATHLSAALELGGLAVWKKQIEALRETLPMFPGPLLIAGDFNTTRFRPEFRRLLNRGLSDAIVSLGAGRSRSIKVAASGPLAAIGPIARVDHVLVDKGVWALSMENLKACGSDHLPIKLRVALHADATPHKRRV